MGEYLTLRCGEPWERSQLKIQEKINKIGKRTNKFGECLEKQDKSLTGNDWSTV